MKRPNSVAAYEKNLEVSPFQRAKVYRLIKKTPGVTRQELASPQFPINVITPRVTELLACGVIYEDGVKVTESGQKRSCLYARKSA